LSNRKPGILNNYIRIDIIMCKDQREKLQIIDKTLK
jgi:hypothetical protein